MISSILAVVLEKQWDLSTVQKGFIGSSFFIGFALGSVCSGYLADKLFGRLPILMVAAFSTLAFGIFCSVVDDYSLFVAIRCCIGCSVGVTISTDKSYIAEILPSR